MAEYLTLRVSPELAELLRRPGGYQSQGRVTFWLDQDHVMNVREDGCSCGCHEVVQPGLVPCPTCDHSSRYERGVSGPGAS